MLSTIDFLLRGASTHANSWETPFAFALTIGNAVDVCCANQVSAMVQGELSNAGFKASSPHEETRTSIEPHVGTAKSFT